MGSCCSRTEEENDENKENDENNENKIKEIEKKDQQHETKRKNFAGYFEKTITNTINTVKPIKTFQNPIKIRFSFYYAYDDPNGIVKKTFPFAFLPNHSDVLLPIECEYSDANGFEFKRVKIALNVTIRYFSAEEMNRLTDRYSLGYIQTINTILFKTTTLAKEKSSDLINRWKLETRKDFTRMDENEFKHLCMICVSNEAYYVCVPCGHFGYCNACVKHVKAVKMCHMCRSKVDQTIKVYFN